ncbi:ABC transporter ATP-binding protein [Pseudodesulfovibrio cashew]|uniref:ABC transporter ATP-binding protein n=1 Tax=Pseudodesulfovibrio cashew TaxID=2678688 RepID=UPI00131AC604|nr:ABC transporter ATP-binding protein [Pseudodesulfovibrio cashew]
MLRTNSLCKSFGAIRATQKVDLHVKKDTVHSIIGPNGAGKTTLFNLLAGVFPPTSGTVIFKDEDVSGNTVNERCALGVGRSFQVTSIFPELTVAENVRLACQAKTGLGRSLFKLASRSREVNDKADSILEFMGILHLRDEAAGTISYGSQRSLDVAIAIGTEPDLLLLDEPTSGMSPDDTVRMIELIHRLAERYTIVLIEHHMNVVMSISDTISVLHMGELIAEGTPEEIQNNDLVRKAYLGESTW